MGAHTATKNATSSANIASGGGGGVWTNSAFAAVEDGNNATIALGATVYSDYLRATCGALTYLEPSGRVTITGVACEVLGFADTDNATQITYAILWNGLGTAGSSVAASKPIPLSATWGDSGLTIGGDGEMWGLSAADLKTTLGAKFFGFQFYAEEILGVGANVEIDAMRVTVYYDLPRRHNLLGCGR